MDGCSVVSLWFSVILGLLQFTLGILTYSPHRMPVLFWTSVFAPITYPAFVFGLHILFVYLTKVLEKIGLRRHTNITNTNQATATVAAVEENALQPEQREPPNTNGAHSFNVASLPMYLYDKEAAEGGLVCPICKELFAKSNVVVQLPLCIHCYHKECIEAWLRRNLACPVCRCRVDMEIPRDIALIINS